MSATAYVEEGTMVLGPGAPATPDIPVLEMVEPIPGLPDHRRFALIRLDEAGVLCALRAVDEPELRLLVVPPNVFFSDYAPEIADDAVESLGVRSAEDVLLLVVVNPGASPREATANLLAPVLVNVTNRRARQVILDADLPVRARLSPV